jgi:hypothetical protein
MKLLIKFPTRTRPEIFFKTLDLYYNLLSKQNEYHFLISCDIDDLSMTNIRHRFDVYNNLSVFFDQRTTKIGAINRDMDKAPKDWDILLLASDDMIPVIQDYDLYISKNMASQFPDTNGMLWFNDGFRQDLMTLVVMGRKYYENFGYIFNPIYETMCCDNELMAVGQNSNRIKYYQTVIIEHRHYSFGMKNPAVPKDILYSENMIAYSKDRNILAKRKEEGFK